MENKFVKFIVGVISSLIFTLIVALLIHVKILPRYNSKFTPMIFKKYESVEKAADENKLLFLGLLIAFYWSFRTPHQKEDNEQE